MIRFIFKTSFKRAFKKRFGGNQKILSQVRERIEIFQDNPRHPYLHDHALKGKREGFRSFSVTGDVRIIYYWEDNIAYFVDIGTHNQVY